MAYPMKKIRSIGLNVLFVSLFELANMPVAQANTLLSNESEFRSRAMVQKTSDPYYKPEPEYAKWGKIAVSETTKRYPEASVVDYLHVGRSLKGDTLVQESFKLWLRSASREFGVLVTIVFDKNTEKIRSIEFCETKR